MAVINCAEIREIKKNHTDICEDTTEAVARAKSIGLPVVVLITAFTEPIIRKIFRFKSKEKIALQRKRDFRFTP